MRIVSASVVRVKRRGIRGFSILEFRNCIVPRYLLFSVFLAAAMSLPVTDELEASEACVAMEVVEAVGEVVVAGCQNALRLGFNSAWVSDEVREETAGREIVPTAEEGWPAV